MSETSSQINHNAKILSDFPKYIPILTALIYILGFIVLNSHLSNFGVFDYNALNPRFMASGFLFALYITCYFMFAGRKVINGLQELHTMIGANSVWEHRNSKFWRIWAVLDYLLECLLAVFLSIAAFHTVSTLSMPSREVLTALSLLVIYRSILPYINTYAGRHVGVLTEAMGMLLTCSIFVYSTLLSESSVITLKIYLCASLIVGVIFADGRFMRNADIGIFTILYGVLLIIGSSILFGLNVYSAIPTRLGGGSPISATILIDEKQQSGAVKLGIGTNPYQANILHQNNDFILIRSQDGVFQLRRDWVQAIRIN